MVRVAARAGDDPAEEADAAADEIKSQPKTAVRALADNAARCEQEWRFAGFTKPPANDQESRDYTSDELFFAEAQAQPFIEPEEERELSSRATAGDEDAANALVKSHLRLIIKLAREFRGRHTHAGLELSELISEGNVAAMRAIKTFDATKGRFATHATTWIKHELEKFRTKLGRKVAADIDNANEIPVEHGPSRACDDNPDQGAGEFKEPKRPLAWAKAKPMTAQEMAEFARRKGEIKKAEIVVDASPDHCPQRAPEDDWTRGFRFGRGTRLAYPDDASADFKEGCKAGRSKDNFAMLEALWARRTTLIPEFKALLDRGVEDRRRQGLPVPGERPVYWLRCRCGCNKEFKANRSDAKYFSDTHRKRDGRKIISDTTSAKSVNSPLVTSI
jgi:RNA polymerase sigma factor (sigma-70 family)